MGHVVLSPFAGNVSEDAVTIKEAWDAIARAETEALGDHLTFVSLEPILSKLASGASQRTAEGWRSIATAPKDGTAVLGFMPSYYRMKGGISVMLWMDFADHHAGWYDLGAFKTEPSYWQPLPPPPSSAPGITPSQEPKPKK